MSNNRETAIKILQDVLEKKDFFTATDDAFINMLLLTTFRHLAYIKKALKQFAKKKIPNKHRITEYALILGTTEALYLDSPDYAVINSYVEIIKKHADKYLAGFANAVLRNITRHKEELQKKDTGEFFPPEFLQILKKDYNRSAIHKIEQAAIKEPDLDITIKSDADSWAKKLDGDKLDDFSIRLRNKAKVPELAGYNEGAWWVQDYAASLAVKMLTDIEELSALDICAAPGGKTAQLINLGAKTTALDISETRLETLRENLKRLQLKAENIICTDGIEYLKTTKEQFDIILLDAPCSATGTIRRHPELVHIKTIEDVKNMSKVQKEFLENISNALKIGGILIYCTCSISHLEGEKQIAEFLEKNPNFKLSEQIRTLPSDTPVVDSFFIAKLEKTS